MGLRIMPLVLQLHSELHVHSHLCLLRPDALLWFSVGYGRAREAFGSKFFTEIQPLVTLNKIAAVLDFETMGANILPSPRNESVAVGAETGGSILQNAVSNAIEGEGLDVSQVCLLPKVLPTPEFHHCSCLMQLLWMPPCNWRRDGSSRLW